MNIGTGLALIGLIVPLFAVTNSFAYKQTQTCSETGRFECEEGERPKGISWPTRCVRYWLHERGSSDIEPGPNGKASKALQRAVNESFDAWNAPSCSDLQMVPAGLTPIDRTDDSDVAEGINLIIWRDDSWPFSSASAFALTSVTFNPKSANILDADIELNGEFYDFTIDSDASVAQVDVRNTLTHEAGHFLGLDHSSVREATMFGSAPIGQTSKRTLSTDDINGLCDIYPSRSPRAVCQTRKDFELPDEESFEKAACSVANGKPSDRSGSWFFASIALLFLAIRRWPRSRR